MGVEMGITRMDERGRIVIPKEYRERLGLRPEQEFLIEIRGDELILKPAVSVETFIEKLRGCVHGSKIKPLELKKIWGVKL
ncbi:AbrB/MazE/SpoVT family DNA-binding domain-containing protein [Candidatus Bathyarchaeota archaeon]|nr:MAG: AbrB/MazE/SpoVT family DNA-binding domain-containing protein [Candidatus Bathyarchaeota archaeon]